MKQVHITECPRDAMQGIDAFIPTHLKIHYIKALCLCGFHRIDFGSFVHPKAIPQMADTEEVAKALEGINHPELLAIVGNLKGAERALPFEHVRWLGFPFSISQTFLERNIKSNLTESWKRLLSIRDLAHKNNKKVQVYISMAFGNPYGDPYHEDLVLEWVEKLMQEELPWISLSDTIGEANPEQIRYLWSHLNTQFPEAKAGAHLHTRPDNLRANVEAAWESGCVQFDGALHGFGGCPMAKDELTGNLPTEALVAFLEEQNAEIGIQKPAFEAALRLASEVFPQH
jgi:hydroxymethylglutaryl-CoA lyase